MAAYQTFDERRGASRSEEKLKALRLPQDLSGKSVLDLGCNEGFFALEAKRRGASRVVGIDRKGPVIQAAREHARREGLDVEFRAGNMLELPDDKFDIVLLLSALHYVPEPADFLARIRSILAPGGMLVLECGISTQTGMGVERALRVTNDERYFPSMELMERVWLDGYAVRSVGRSVPQSGDPIPRQVLHCSPRSPSVLFIQGAGGIGKSGLASLMEGAPVIATDRLLTGKRFEKYQPAPEQKAIDDAKERSGGRIGPAWAAEGGDPAVQAYFAQRVADAIRACAHAPLIVVEGLPLVQLSKEVERLLGPGYRCWTVSRGA